VKTSEVASTSDVAVLFAIGNAENNYELNNFFKPELRKRSDILDVWFQQDEAPPTAIATMKVVRKMFAGRFIYHVLGICISPSRMRSMYFLKIEMALIYL